MWGAEGTVIRGVLSNEFCNLKKATPATVLTANGLFYAAIVNV